MNRIAPLLAAALIAGTATVSLASSGERERHHRYENGQHERYEHDEHARGKHRHTRSKQRSSRYRRDVDHHGRRHHRRHSDD